MADSTLNTPVEPATGVGSGHTNAELGPSDSSDSGSDVRGAVRRPGEIEDALDNHALEGGELELEGDSDRYGTGERASADGDGALSLDDDILPSRDDAVSDIADAADSDDGAAVDGAEDVDNPEDMDDESILKAEADEAGAGRRVKP